MKDLKQQFLNIGLLDGVKTEIELTQLLKQLHSTALESMLQGDLDAHLGYSKNSKSNNSNSRNGKTTKHIKTEFGKSEIAVPRDREGSFEPVVVLKHKSNSLSVENIVISLYA